MCKHRVWGGGGRGSCPNWAAESSQALRLILRECAYGAGRTLLLTFRHTGYFGASVDANGSSDVDMQQQQHQTVDAVHAPQRSGHRVN